MGRCLDSTFQHTVYSRLSTTLPCPASLPMSKFGSCKCTRRLSTHRNNIIQPRAQPPARHDRCRGVAGVVVDGFACTSTHCPRRQRRSQLLQAGLHPVDVLPVAVAATAQLCSCKVLSGSCRTGRHISRRGQLMESCCMIAEGNTLRCCMCLGCGEICALPGL
eukprot:GHRQ01032743.1.p1 GENE.GHRQ01032743.1~~GHRQ01032743.1.p1  ORF type:complete len:163 (+),score=13.32 GHRQ01032743.1:437-925(+)